MDLDKRKRNPKKIECGYVYVLCQDRKPDYVKVGCSKDPDARLEQLKQEFSMPKLKIKHTSKKVADVRSLEALIHTILIKDNQRVPFEYIPPNGKEKKTCYEWFSVHYLYAASLIDIWAK
ncbi:hypothetical protein BFW01_g10271 [Lasiodiplodia theobromae]|uniref:Bacteriophage T5 Orf172 DNA-binding domain-containing protein n=1 Tax=Lasiodiplodia theobromae TaxID=45133 RepID=A0A8H7INL4_9PEZI|nr:hypothetical protein BFW01_g10271 [Lasiodiplodia theobromae]